MAKILIAQDNKVTAELIVFRLSNAGHELLRAEDGVEALDLAERERPDLIILDILLPELDGFEVLQRLKEDPVLAAIPVMILTAKAQEHDVLMGLSAGADDYMVKPFSFPELLARIGRLTTDRQTYVRMALRTRYGQTFVGELLTLSRDTARTRFPREGGPVLAIGERTSIWLTSPRFPEPVELEGTVTTRAESEPYRNYGLRLEGGPQISDQLSDEFFLLVGRRRVVRVKPALEEPVKVELAAADSPPGEFPLTAHMADISTGGALLLLAPAAERLLVSVECVKTRFRLPGSRRMLEIRARIRHRALATDGLNYGIRFDLGSSDAAEAQRQELARYVVRRQRAGAAGCAEGTPDGEQTRG